MSQVEETQPDQNPDETESNPQEESEVELNPDDGTDDDNDSGDAE